MVADALKETRTSLYAAYENLTDQRSILEFQLLLFQEIISIESVQKRDRSIEQSNHLHLLRVIGDALAWGCLHPHAIRQLAKNVGHSAHIHSQGKAFQGVLDAARQLVDESGVAVLISDLTHCIRIGDLIVVGDPEAPGIIEVKSSGSSSVPPRGRAGRQLRRMKNTYEYLKSGTAKFDSEDVPRLAIEVDIPLMPVWQVVEEICIRALDTGKAGRALSDSHFIWAFSDDDDSLPPDSLFEHAKLRPSQVGCHLVPIEEAWPTVPPPLLWKVRADIRRQLMEGDLVLMSIFAPESLVGISHGNATIVGVEMGSGEGQHGYVVDVNGHKTWASSVFTDRIVYGFEDSKRVGETICQFALRSTAKVHEKKPSSA